MAFIKEINESEFIEEVVEKSKSTPVIVDWALRCGPCKQLTPTLESVNKKNGKVILVKINGMRIKPGPAKYPINTWYMVSSMESL